MAVEPNDPLDNKAVEIIKELGIEQAKELGARITHLTRTVSFMLRDTTNQSLLAYFLGDEVETIEYPETDDEPGFKTDGWGPGF